MRVTSPSTTTSGTPSSRRTGTSSQRARQAPGCLDVAITADPVDPGRVNNFERWETWDAIEAWRKRAHAPDTGIEIGEMDVTAYEVASTRPPF